MNDEKEKVVILDSLGFVDPVSYFDNNAVDWSRGSQSPSGYPNINKVRANRKAKKKLQKASRRRNRK